MKILKTITSGVSRSNNASAMSSPSLPPYSSIECLPNEIFLEIFCYLSHVDCVCVFGRLNDRLKRLTDFYCTCFNFQSTSRPKFDYVTKNHEIQRWRSLTLSSDDQTPGQVTRFCHLFPWSTHCQRLERLVLHQITEKEVQLYLSSLSDLTNLVSLTLNGFCGSAFPSLHLPLLKFLKISSCLDCRWMKNFDQLETLHHTIEDRCHHQEALAWPKQLKALTIILSRSVHVHTLRGSLSGLSQLVRLAIYDGVLKNSPPDGFEWEQFICQSMPLLKTFRFCFKFWQTLNHPNSIQAIIATFSTPFYLSEKCCFVQCDTFHEQCATAILYSLPYAFDHFELVTKSFDQSISTWSSDRSTKIFPTVKRLTIGIACDSIDSHLLSNRITQLTINVFPKLSPFSSLSFPYLKELTLASYIRVSSNDSLQLLTQSPQLKSLIVSYQTLQSLTNHWNDKKVCSYLSRKIRSLKIISDRSSSINAVDYIQVLDLLPLIRTFQHRCEHLSLTIYSRNLVVGLILRTMTHLRSLKVRLIEQGDEQVINRQWLVTQGTGWEKLADFLTVNHDEYSFWLGHRR